MIRARTAGQNPSGVTALSLMIMSLQIVTSFGEQVKSTLRTVTATVTFLDKVKSYSFPSAQAIVF